MNAIHFEGKPPYVMNLIQNKILYDPKTTSPQYIYI